MPGAYEPTAEEIAAIEARAKEVRAEMLERSTPRPSVLRPAFHGPLRYRYDHRTVLECQEGLDPPDITVKAIRDYRRATGRKVKDEPMTMTAPQVNGAPIDEAAPNGRCPECGRAYGMRKRCHHCKPAHPPKDGRPVAEATPDHPSRPATITKQARLPVPPPKSESIGDCPDCGRPYGKIRRCFACKPTRFQMDHGSRPKATPAPTPTPTPKVDVIAEQLTPPVAVPADVRQTLPAVAASAGSPVLLREIRAMRAASELLGESLDRDSRVRVLEAMLDMERAS